MLNSLYARLAAATTPEEKDAAEEAAEGPRGRKSNGPVKFRHVTNGQIRRAERRALRTQQRKQTKVHHRAWFRNQQAIASLRGQLQYVGALPLHDGTYAKGTSPFIAKLLEERYGSVQEALEFYESIEDEREKAAREAQVQALAAEVAEAGIA